MKRRLSEKLVLYKHREQYRHLHQRRRAHKVTVGVGGNMGDAYRRIFHLLHFLRKDKKLSLHQVSPVLKNPPFGFLAQDDFFNAVVTLSTDLKPRACLKYLLQIEKKFGRRRSFQDAPRTLDLDMIFFDHVVMDHKALTLPHPGWHQRESVLIPLQFIH